MALTKKQQQARDAAIEGITNGATDGVASFIKENYKFLGIIAPTLPDSSALTNADYRAFAREAIDSQTIGGVPLDIINEQLMTHEASKRFVLGRGATHVKQLIPNRDQVNEIAGAASNAVVDNIGSYRFGITNIGHGVSGLFGKGAIHAAAESMRSDTIKNLNKLKEKRPDIALILDEPTINRIGKEVEARAIDTAFRKEGETTPAKPDVLDNVTVKPVDAVTRSAVYDMFGNEVYKNAEAGISNSVEERLDKVRNNGILGFIFRILEALGIEKLVAGWFGMKIPEKEDVQNAASVIAKTTQDVTAENAASLTKTELVEKVRSSTLTDLRKHRESYPSFDDESLQEMASKAAQGVSDNYDRIPKIAISDDVRKLADQAAENSKGKTNGGVDSEHTPAQPGTKLADAGQRR